VRVSAERWAFLAGITAIITIALIDLWLDAGPRTLWQTGVADETAHLLTAILLLSLLPKALPDRFFAGALVGAVAIDLDHLPLILGSDLLTRETNRPLSHSLLSIMVALALAAIAPARWRATLLGIGAGFALHFWRDMATSTAGVPLLWPLQKTGFVLPYSVYFASLIACVAVMAARQLWQVARRTG
jgi:inner membrane protein